MGWLYTRKDKSTSVAEFFAQRWNQDTDTEKWEVLDCAVVKFNTAYMAIRHTRKATGQTVVYAVVTLLGYDRKSHWYNFGYKDIGESCGPCQADCPERILKLLSPVEEVEEFFNYKEKSYAQDWRDRCRKNLETAKTARTFFTVGSVYQASHPIKMSNNVSVTQMEVVQTNPLQFRSPEYGFLFNLSKSFVKNLISKQALTKLT